MTKLEKNNPAYLLKIGINIRKWRELKGIKQEQLANQLGITKAALSNIENDKTDISLHRIEDIARCLDLEVMKLFNNPLDLLLHPH
ncbi:MAG: helix-turn-helix transcriptional regulator [Chitinophagaceae bacterium]|nr:helix-turn-helix transcriptional regulator [Chitinophagaceae bacterium]MBK8785500.1 helix-turn-helix transcriptional regulator [Chitinophagaceae bacterium]MBK9486828.1 helix-turn-helix transcriptional regulator [Chitinophagaceae bacterium]MBL0199277.1 helix-turn-helix transcriptional regulator [Chitinophagaceae bacterium]